jgi:hypothetical protein
VLDIRGVGCAAGHVDSLFSFPVFLAFFLASELIYHPLFFLSSQEEVSGYR